MPTVLKIAVCLFQDVASLDYQGPMEQIGFLSASNLAKLPKEFGLENTPYIVEATYLATSEHPILPAAGPRLFPDRTYDSVGADEQFDVVLVPGGVYLIRRDCNREFSSHSVQDWERNLERSLPLSSLFSSDKLPDSSTCCPSVVDPGFWRRPGC